MQTGPTFREQMQRFGRQWEQGEHILITGPTKSGKTTLARHVVEQRLKRRGFVMVLIGKLTPDPTIADEYQGWTRWTTLRSPITRRWRTPAPHENKILLMPNIEKIHNVRDKRLVQREVFRDAFDYLADKGRWTVQIDEGLYTADPSFLGLGMDLGMIHNLGRTSHVSLVTLAQRPAHLPKVLYSAAAHAFAGRAATYDDRKRLAELPGDWDQKQLYNRIATQKRHEFTWIPVAVDEGKPETVDVSR